MQHSRKGSSSSTNSKSKSLEATSADITSIPKTLSRKNSKEDEERKVSMDKGGAPKIVIGKHAEQSTLDEWEPIEDDDDPDQEKGKSSKSRSRGKRVGNILLPKSAKEIYKMFTLRTTNQILRGVSPTTTGSLSPRFPSQKEKQQILEKEKEDKPKKDWMELIASEIYSAKVNIVPPPSLRLGFVNTRSVE